MIFPSKVTKGSEEFRWVSEALHSVLRASIAFSLATALGSPWLEVDGTEKSMAAWESDTFNF